MRIGDIGNTRPRGTRRHVVRRGHSPAHAELARVKGDIARRVKERLAVDEHHAARTHLHALARPDVNAPSSDATRAAHPCEEGGDAHPAAGVVHGRHSAVKRRLPRRHVQRPQRLAQAADDNLHARHRARKQQKEKNARDTPANRT